MVLIISSLDPKNDIGNVKSIKDPIVKHLKFPFKTLCRRFKFKQYPSYLGLVETKFFRIHIVNPLQIVMAYLGQLYL